MRRSMVAVVSLLLGSTNPVLAKDTIGTAPPAAWVKPVASPAAPAPGEAPATLLLIDQQVRLEPGATSIYTRQQVRIDSAAGLSAGNLSLSWQPDQQEITVHGVKLLRGKQVIDLLAKGQSFSVLRRETNLDQAMLDGVLTANFQSEGVEVGDVIELSASVTTRDPLLAGTAEMAVMPPAAGYQRYALALTWPASFPLTTRATGGIAVRQLPEKDRMRGLALTIDKPPVTDVPANMPARMLTERRVEATSFADWGTAGALLAPLYVKASVIPPSGPLRDEVNRIAAATADPTRRAELALALTQERIRYVALSMGAGGLTPQDAATTWSRRFGDCKAKTALLIGLLRELGISSVPVAVSSTLGDGMDRRLPMIGHFDHILVRADVAGKPFFLDGTRSGDVTLAQLEVPMFRWGLEVVPSGGRLIPIMPPPRTTPTDESETIIDASAGFILPAKTRATLTYRGDGAKGIIALWKQMDAAQRDMALKDQISERFPAIEVTSVTAHPDPKAAEFRLVAEGTMRIGRSAILMSAEPEQEASEDRKPGPFQSAPLSLTYPAFTRVVTTLIVPADFPATGRQSVTPVDKVIAGVEHKRSGGWSGNRFTVVGTERTLVPEISWSDAVAARPAIKTFAEDMVRFRRPAEYRPSENEAEKLAKLPAEGETELLTRAFDLLNNGRPDLSIAALNKLLVTSPKSAAALSNRGIAYAWQDKPVEANRDLDAAEKIDPDQPVIYRGRGLLARSASEPRLAIRWFERSLELDPDNLFAISNLAEINASLGDYEAALAAAERMQALKASDSDVHLLRASIFRAQGQFDKATAELSALADSKVPAVQWALGWHYSSLGRYPEALAALDRGQALEARPDYYLVRADHRAANDRAGGEADLKAYLATEPTAPEAIRMMASLLEDQGKFREAAALYTKAMAKLSDPSALRPHRGAALIRAGDLAAGRKDIMSSLPAELSPKQLANRHNEICWALATAGVELDLALKHCNEAIRLEPKVSGYLDSRGLVHLRQGKLDLALADYDAALERGLFASGLMGRSLVHARRGDRVKAEADRRAAERLNARVAALYVSYGLDGDGHPIVATTS